MSSSNREAVRYRRHADRSEEPRSTNINSIATDTRYITEVAKSCERIFLDARPDFFFTLRFVVKTVSIVAAIAIVGYYLVQIVPNLAFLLSGILVDLPLGIVSALSHILVDLPLGIVSALSRILVDLPLGIVSSLSGVLDDLPLGIVSALCGLVAPVLDLGFVQLPVAIGRGVLSLLPRVLWVVNSLFFAVGWVLLATLYMITSLLSRVMSVISSVPAIVLGFRQQYNPQILPVRPILM